MPTCPRSLPCKSGTSVCLQFVSAGRPLLLSLWSHLILQSQNLGIKTLPALGNPRTTLTGWRHLIAFLTWGQEINMKPPPPSWCGMAGTKVMSSDTCSILIMFKCSNFNTKQFYLLIMDWTFTSGNSIFKKICTNPSLLHCFFEISPNAKHHFFRHGLPGP